MKRSRGVWSLPGLLIIALCATPCFATQVRPLNLEQLTARAGRIVSGRCARVEVLDDVELRLPVTQVTVLVDRSLKGPGGRTVTFRMIGDRSAQRAGGAGTVGLPTFTPGEEVVLFLYPESAAGLTSPVGLGQGKFTVARRKQGGSIAVNAFGSHGLLRGMSDQARGRLGDLALRETGRPPVARDVLLQMIERLLEPGGAP